MPAKDKVGIKRDTVQSLGKEKGPCRKSSKLQHSKANACALCYSVEEQPCIRRLGAAWLCINFVVDQNMK